jgi:putative PEP-CTERM system TPR-repeat lipoprotein
MALALLTACSRPEVKAAKYLERGNEFFERKDFTRAVLEYKNAIQAQPGQAEGHYRLALVHLETGEAKTAVLLLRKALTLDPKHMNAQLRLAEMMAFSRNPQLVEESEKRLQEIIASFPDQSEGFNLLALAEWRLGKIEDAEKHLQEALARFPAQLRSSVTLASLKISQKDLPAAEQILRDAVRQAPRSADAVLALGRFYVLAGKLEEAHNQFQIAHQLDSGKDEVLMDLGQVQFARGQKELAAQSFQKLSRLPQSRFKTLYAVFLFQNGKPQAALEELERLRKADPRDRKARSLLISLHLNLKQIAQAQQILNDALRQNSSDVEARLERSQILLNAAKYAEAQDDLTHVLRFQPDLAQAHYLLARLHRALGEPLLERQELSSALTSNSRLLPCRVELSRNLIADKAAQAALDLMNQVPKEQAGAPAAIIQRNWALLAVRNTAETRKQVDQALSQHRLPELLLQDAVLKLGEKNFRGARISLEEALRGSPENPRILNTLVATYTLERQFSQALDLLRSHVRQYPQSAALQALLGHWLFQARDYAGARAAYTAAKSLVGQSAIAELALAEIDITEGKREPARQRLMTLVAEARGGAAATAAFELANLAQSAGNHQEALSYYRKTVELMPSHALALNNLAYLLADFAKQPDEALKYAEQAMETAPDNVVIEDTLGWIYYQKGIYHRAIRHLENAAQKEGQPIFKYHLGLAYAKAGNRPQAVKVLSAALRTAPHLPEAALAQQVIEAK